MSENFPSSGSAPGFAFAPGSAPGSGPQKVSHRHEAILQWILTNPEKRLKDCAQEFGLTQAWLSCIVHSDAFQEKLKERQDECFSSVVVGLRERLAGVAQAAVERLGEKVEQSQDPNFLLKAADMTLKNLNPHGVGGLGGSGVTVNQNNFYAMADRETLRKARDKMRLMAQETALPVLVPEVGALEDLQGIELLGDQDEAL